MERSLLQRLLFSFIGLLCVVSLTVTDVYASVDGTTTATGTESDANFLTKAWDAVKTGTGTAVNILKDFIGDTQESGIGSAVSNIGNNVKDNIKKSASDSTAITREETYKQMAEIFDKHPDGFAKWKEWKEPAKNLEGVAVERRKVLCSVISDIIVTLRAKGFSDAGIAGILGNVAYEGQFDPFVVERELTSYFNNATIDSNFNVTWTEKRYWNNAGTIKDTYEHNGDFGIGLFQFTDSQRGGCSNATALVEYAESLDSSKAVVVPVVLNVRNCFYKIAPVAEGGSKYVDRDGFVVPGTVEQCTFLADSYMSAENLERMKNATDAWQAIYDFCMYVEKPYSTEEKRKEVATARANAGAELFGELLNVGALGSSASIGSLSSISTAAPAVKSERIEALATSKAMTSEELGAFLNMCEIDVQSSYLTQATRDYLTSGEIYQLDNWKKNIGDNTFESIIVRLCRRIVLLFGILLTIWGSFMYIAYWFDRTNSIIPIRLVRILSFGRLDLAEDYDKATYGLFDGEKHGTRTLNHRSALFVMIVSIAFGVFILTGGMFNVLSYIVYRILAFLD